MLHLGSAAARVSIQMILVPELGAERILLIEVYVAEPLGGRIAHILDRRAVRIGDKAESGSMRWLDALRFGLGDLRLGASHAAAGPARARPGIEMCIRDRFDSDRVARPRPSRYGRRS